MIRLYALASLCLLIISGMLLLIMSIIGHEIVGGDMLAYSSRNPTRSGNVFLSDVQRNLRVNITHSHADNFQVTWSPDGESLAYASFESNMTSITITHSDGRIQQQVPVSGGLISPLIWLPDNRTLAYLTPTTDENNEFVTSIIWLLDIVSGEITPFTQLVETANVLDFSLSPSPDGRTMTLTSHRNDNADVMSIDMTTREMTLLTTDPGADGNAVWSPDGRFISFESWRDGNYELYIMNSDGTGRRQLTNNTQDDMTPQWSPDGETILFRSHRNSMFNLYLLEPDTGRVRQLTNDSVVQAHYNWSPDGRYIVYWEITQNQSRLALMSINDGVIRYLISDATETPLRPPAWRPQ